ncbi:flagellar export chaperone FliS [Dermatophilus congolensis]|uniref:flagellar export chaperone FliS n=1 Tax=Dermatophilus congolensis TaxID=1863 RepID=UPI001AAF23D8|nr:flagellar export chaperone FliS [Dermatophilus congolensis]MBO3143418.1 flagellar export chaperone FliS [Dermatophilus congolensis]MBO3152408.1 flagellar export chaperone FliS [Dermatophilus congolensis]MBO3160581.1 flagellar export chaperone FliS [Dermatophilus congolensis]MBO3163695.1 flagellar export chaperone FliS [Dermatophilus congolensis]MBO3177242.1 flagellar export chaperone FliS [Dermatophilus congolensis]
MSTQAQLRNRYAREAVTTATPAQLVVMLYDRFLKDLSTAETALGSNDISTTHNALMHAQEIVRELRSSLDTSIWKEGESLARLYDWVLEELMAANLEKNTDHITNARDVMQPLRDTWAEVTRSGITGEK